MEAQRDKGHPMATWDPDSNLGPNPDLVVLQLRVYSGQIGENLSIKKVAMNVWNATVHNYTEKENKTHLPKQNSFSTIGGNYFINSLLW